MRFLATLAVLFSSLLSGPGAALAEPKARVVLVRPATPAPWTDEMLMRAAGELRAAGFDPVTAEAAPGETPRATFKRVDPTAVAVISVDPTDAEVWVEDRLTGKISIRPTRVSSAPPRAASDVAIEAVELLRASLIELTVRSRDAFASKELPRAAVVFAEAALPAAQREDERGVFRFVAGPAAFVGFDPGSVHFAPMIAAGLASRAGFGGRMRFIGPGAGPTLDAPGGTVSWSPWLLAGGPSYEGSLSERWWLRGSVDVGIFHLTAEGDLAEPAESRGGSTLDAVFLGGGALGLAMTEHVSLTLGLELLVTAPPPTVEVGGDTIATVGRPWVLVPIALEITP